MKQIVFIGDSLRCLRMFPRDARQDVGYQLDKLQRQENPDNFKPMPGIGKAVQELRIWGKSGTYRVVYTAKLPNKVCVLHAFQKKSKTTQRREIKLAKRRYAELVRGTRHEQ